MGPDGPAFRDVNAEYADLSAELAQLERTGHASRGAGLEDDFEQARERLKRIYLALARARSVEGGKQCVENMLRALDDLKARAKYLLADGE